MSIVRRRRKDVGKEDSLVRDDDKKEDIYLRPTVAWGQVVCDTLKIDNPMELTRRLRSELELGDLDRTSYAAILIALDKSASNLDNAGRLYRAAKVEEARYESGVKERIEVLRTAALAELTEEYKAKKRRSPTKDDIEDRIISSWPEEYKSLTVRLAELHGAVKSLEILLRAWQSRCADLRIMAERVSRANVG